MIHMRKKHNPIARISLINNLLLSETFDACVHLSATVAYM